MRTSARRSLPGAPLRLPNRDTSTSAYTSLYPYPAVRLFPSFIVIASSSIISIMLNTFPTSFHDDPHPLLVETGEITPFGRGRYGFGPKMSALMEYFDTSIRRMAAKCGAEARAFPSLIGAPSCRSSLVKSIGMERLGYGRSATSDVECLLSPSVCFH